MDSVRKCLDNGVLMYLCPLCSWLWYFHYFVAAMLVQTILAHCISEAGNIGKNIGKMKRKKSATMTIWNKKCPFICKTLFLNLSMHFSRWSLVLGIQSVDCNDFHCFRYWLVQISVILIFTIPNNVWADIIFYICYIWVWYRKSR